VKGDVHDIGKNRVGVVLGCNGYEVIDMGVMVPAEKILQAAKENDVSIIGLSGLITPSLDEMVHIAKEMKRRNFSIPLMIGGATTSRMHTAVRIAPEYDNGIVHVLDASRSVTVAGSLLNKDTKAGFLQGIKKEYEDLKTDFGARRSAKSLLTYKEAQKNKFNIDWENFKPVKPSFTGTRVFKNYSLDEISSYIDWQPFFIAWEMHGKFPQILNDEKIGKQATILYNDAQTLLKKILDEKWLFANGVVGFWEAAAISADTIEVKWNDHKVRLESLRQQIRKAPGQPNLSLADFIKPRQSPNTTGQPQAYSEGPSRDEGVTGSAKTGEPNAISTALIQQEVADHIGAFAVTIHGIEKHIKRFEQDLDDYNKIILQALADRLAEAFAELLHEKTRKQFWGYATEEHLSVQELIEERYLGIRPAPGYPACPDHTEKYKLFELLNATENAGIILTESLAMYPASSVCGWYFAHPESKYFGVGKIAKDQAEDYAKRKNMPLEEIERWLRPQLDYDT